MIESYIDIYKKSDGKCRLDIIKRFLEKMFPQFNFNVIDNYDVIYTRDKFQFYVGKEYVGELQCDDYAICNLELHDRGKYLLFRCYEQNLNKIIYDLLEVEDAHR